MEFFWDPQYDSRGVTFFDDQGRLIVHVLHALLGYGGSGPMFSKQIMLHLGVSEEMFQDIQSALWDQRPYKKAREIRLAGLPSFYTTSYSRFASLIERLKRPFSSIATSLTFTI